MTIEKLKATFQPAIAEGKRVWYAIPKQYQQAIVFVTAAALTAAAKTLGATFIDSDHPCLQWGCIRHGLGSTLAASVVAGRAAAKTFFMRPGSGPKPQLPSDAPAVSL